jgi:WD40 repeat protein
LGLVKILDLGLALLQAGPRDREEMTAAGSAMGTADYIAPEQATDSHNVDIRADIYSLGCTLYKLLAGRAPFGSPEYKNDVAKMLAHVQQTPPPIAGLRTDLPAELAAVVDRMMAKEPAQRYGTPAEVAAALAPFAAGCDLAQVIAGAIHGVGPAATDPAHSVTTGQLSASPVSDTTPPPHPVISAEGAASAVSQRVTSDVSPLAPVLRGEGLGERGGSRRPRILIALAAAAAAIPLLLGIWVIIRDKGGREVGRFKVPEGGSASVVDDQGQPVKGVPVPAEQPKVEPKTPKPELQPQSKPLKIGPPVPRPKPIPIELKPEPVDLQPGAPVSRLALVSNPATLPGVRSWTIETIGHRGFGEWLAYSPDGNTMATACGDDVIRLWDAKTGRFLRALVGSDGPIGHLCWSPDGKILASMTGRTVRLWDAKSGSRLYAFRGENHFTCVAWSPDGRFLAAGMRPGPSQIWEFQAARELSDPRGSSPRKGWRLMNPGIKTRSLPFDPYRLAWSPDGVKLAGLARRGRRYGIFLYNVASDTVESADVVERAGLTGTNEWGDVAWSPDGQVLACSEVPILLLDTGLRAIGTQIPAEVPPHFGGVLSVAWSAGRHLAYCEAVLGDSYVSVWDFEGTRKLYQRVMSNVHVSWCPLAYSPEGRTLAAGFRLCDAESGTPWHILPKHNGGSVNKSAWSQDLRLLATSSAIPWSGQRNHIPVQVWDVNSGGLLHEIELGNQDNASVLSMVWSPLKVLTMATEEAVHTWEPNFPNRVAKGIFRWRYLHRHALSPDGKMVAFLPEDGACRIFHLPSGKELLCLAGKRIRPTGALFSPCFAFARDASAVAFWVDNQVTICEGPDFQVQTPHATLPAPICGLSWSPDGKTLMAACGDSRVYLIGVGTKQIIAVCEGHETPAASFGWAGDGKTLVTACESCQGETGICVWDARSGKLLRTIRDGGEVSPDGRLVAWRGQSVIRLRETEKGQVVCTMLSLKDSQYAAISPDGHFRGSPDVEKELVYVVQTDQGQETLTPAEFAKKYNWKNDPSKVGQKVESSAAHGPSSPVTKPDRPSAPAAVGQPKPVESKP